MNVDSMNAIGVIVDNGCEIEAIQILLMSVQNRLFDFHLERKGKERGIKKSRGTKTKRGRGLA